MHFYIGTKAILAREMSRGDYCDYRGWPIPGIGIGDDEGMLVEYSDGGESNDPRHKGYISWSPIDVFKAAYKASGEMTFGHAVEALKMGNRVARAGWNGKGLFVYLVPGSEYPEGHPISYRPHLDISMDGGVSTWAPSIGDVLAEDWTIIA